ncbi:MAG: glycosyltransferase family 2 protein [Hyphomicrobium sp.]
MPASPSPTARSSSALDADTHFEPDTIALLARWFADPKIGAVAGNAKVGNRINLITRWQALEYITAQNLERRALSALDCITVVPGAVGAWRRSALIELGGFPTDTLAEDQDLTIAIQKAGYRAVFDPDAVAWTEAPDNRRRTGQTALPLVVRHAAMPVEALRRHAAAALWRARPHRAAAGLAVPDPARPCLAVCRSHADRSVDRRRVRLHGARRPARYRSSRDHALLLRGLHRR